MITIAVDAMGGDHAPRPEVEGAVQAARELGVRILLVGLAPELKKELAKHSASRVAHRDCSGDRSHHHGGLAHAGFPEEEGQLGARRGKAGARRPGRCPGQRGEYRRGDGRGAIWAGHAVFGGPGGAGGSVSDFARRDSGFARRGRERGFQARAPRAVRGDGGNLLPRNFRHAAAKSGAALDRRGRIEGQRVDARGVQPA